ncbi:MalY/PatB family protein [Nocardiopsis changdeensis]|uniref:cysteine-S-conjugate beta-lyase n=1 Tax=Nocardiopsis changdeensis TaxID=2831969 RepID=A0ABX8BHF8_9ACTN|nr:MULTISPECIES: aminotransferase class I/II-fold pyridoxal phosphate-dependent enzyme [Nocardiopsis]QUX20467.1 aminotransferase class I/II-fold pyridoxal phosphate-dependent enzyme [Nocardiopsis changdeensis]QYX36397.1 aminotransferase class I/II-fold pyridoxal phosphate-dependent enzyme [Nocardiopsis sp. MT53]
MEHTAADVPNPLEQPTVEDLRRRTSMKWRTYPEDVLPLWVAEMDVPLAEPVARALHRAVELGDTGYPVGGRAYAEALAGFAQRRWGWKGPDVEHTALVPDVMLGIVEVLRLVTGPGDTVVVNPPVYPPFHAFVTHADRRVAAAPLGADGRLDLDALGEAYAAARARGGRPAHLLCNPHNPTGAVHTADELAAVAALAREYGVRVVADEIHAPLVLDGARFTPYLSVDGAEDAFAVTSASKAWNLAGLKAGLVLAGPGAADDLARMPEEVGHGPSHLGALAHTAALNEGGAWLDALLAGLAANRELLGRLLAEHLPGVGYTPPEGTYLAWLDCRGLGFDDPRDTDGPGVVTDLAGPARVFLDRARVALSSGHTFGSGGAGRVRLNFATSAAVLTEAVRRMGEAVRAAG